MASDPEHWPDVVEPRATRYRTDDHPLREAAEQVWWALEYSSIYLALVGAAEVLVVVFLLSLPLSPAPLVIALVTFAVYANDRLVDVESDEVSNPERTAFVREHRQALYVLAAVAYGVGAALAALGGPLAFAIALLPGAAWVVYAVDWLDVSTVEFDRLKELPVVSSLVVASAWSLAVVLLPVSFAGAALTPTVGVVFVYFLLATFVNAEVSNVRDVESDTENGVATVATALGVERTRTVLYGVSLLVVAVLVGAAAGGLLTTLEAAVLALGVVCLLGVVALVGRTDDGRALSLVAEFTRLPVFAVLATLAFL